LAEKADLNIRILQSIEAGELNVFGHHRDTPPKGHELRLASFDGQGVDHVSTGRNSQHAS
jgi:hypothetical protein